MVSFKSALLITSLAILTLCLAFSLYKAIFIKPSVFNKFFKAIQKATLTIINDPKSTWKDFSTYRKGLEDELNKRAFIDTLPRFTLRPQAHDLNTYKDFGNFLKDKEIIKKITKVETFAKP